jgi:hypothetical protein
METTFRTPIPRGRETTTGRDKGTGRDKAEDCIRSADTAL